jgi:hypothetical protein
VRFIDALPVSPARQPPPGGIPATGAAVARAFVALGDEPFEVREQVLPRPGTFEARLLEEDVASSADQEVDRLLSSVNVSGSACCVLPRRRMSCGASSAQRMLIAHRLGGSDPAGVGGRYPASTPPNAGMKLAGGVAGAGRGRS